MQRPTLAGGAPSSHALAYVTRPELLALEVSRVKYTRAFSLSPSRAQPSANPKSSSPRA